MLSGGKAGGWFYSSQEIAYYHTRTHSVTKIMVATSQYQHFYLCATVSFIFFAMVFTFDGGSLVSTIFFFPAVSNRMHSISAVTFLLLRRFFFFFGKHSISGGFFKFGTDSYTYISTVDGGASSFPHEMTKVLLELQPCHVLP